MEMYWDVENEKKRKTIKQYTCRGRKISQSKTILVWREQYLNDIEGSEVNDGKTEKGVKAI
jgi:hypothetical protein